MCALTAKERGEKCRPYAADRLSPYKFYQYMLQSVDADVVRFMRMLTFMPMDEIEGFEAAMKEEGYVPNTVGSGSWVRFDWLQVAWTIHGSHVGVWGAIQTFCCLFF
jgi:hypothetical protein